MTSVGEGNRGPGGEHGERSELFAVVFWPIVEHMFSTNTL